MASQAELDAKTARIVQLEQSLEEAVRSLEHKNDQLDALERQQQQWQITVQNLRASQLAKERDLEDIRNNAAQVKDLLQEELNSFRKVNGDLQQEITFLRGQLLTTQIAAGRMQQASTSEPSTSTSYGAISQGSCDQCEELQAQLSETRDRLNYQLQELEAISNERIQLQYQMEYFQQSYAPRMLAIEASKVVSEKDSERLKRRLGELGVEKEGLLKEVAALRGQLLATQELVVPLTSTRPSVCGQCAELQAQLDETREQLAQRYGQLEALSDEKLELQLRINSLAAGQKPTALAKEVAEKATDRLRKRVDSLERENADLRKELEDLRGQQLGSSRGQLKVRGMPSEDLATEAKLRSELIMLNEVLKAKEEKIEQLTTGRARTGSMTNSEMLETRTVLDTKRILYSATTGFVLGVLLKCFIK